MPTRKKTAASASTNTEQLRLRVFAGPNGSGKSTVINYVRQLKVNGRSVDFGYYINADDIAAQLKSIGFSFNNFSIKVTKQEFDETAIASGLINDEFSEKDFSASYTLRSNGIKLKRPEADERLAQIIADFRSCGVFIISKYRRRSHRGLAPPTPMYRQLQPILSILFPGRC